MWLPDLDATEPVYLAIVDAIERDLAEGRLRPGDRLPPQRKLARALGLALGTVTRGYAEAEARGLVHGEVGRGTYAGRKAAGNRFGEASTSGIDLALTWPLYGLDPDLGGALRRLATEPDVNRLLEYGPNAGHVHHREAGVAWAAHQGIAAEADRVAVCVGAQHAMTVVLGALLAPGDVLATEPVTYPGLKALAGTRRLRLAPVAMDDDGILPAAFEEVCRDRRPRALYTIPTIQNPTACVLGEERRREIARIAREHDVAIIEDEVHRLLHPDPPPAFATIAPDITFTILSLSKVVTGGLRLAFLLVPPGRAELIGHHIWATTWCAPALPVEVGARWIRDGTAAATADRKRAEAEARRAMAADILAGCGWRAAPHSYHLWLPLPGHWRAADLALESERLGVAISTADVFAITREHAGNAVRISLTGALTRDQLRRGLATIADLLLSRRPGPPVI